MACAGEVAPDLAATLELLVWPLRRPHAGAEDFADRIPEEPLEERGALPFGRNPLFEPVVERAPFRLTLVAVFGPQRAPPAGCAVFRLLGDELQRTGFRAWRWESGCRWTIARVCDRAIAGPAG